MGKTKIVIDYTKCGYENGVQIDPRECRKCMNVCDPAVFLMHPTLHEHEDPYNPEEWLVTAVWPSMCTGCNKCVEICPVNAITLIPGKSLFNIIHGI